MNAHPTVCISICVLRAFVLEDTLWEKVGRYISLRIKLPAHPPIHVLDLYLYNADCKKAYRRKISLAFLNHLLINQLTFDRTSVTQNTFFEILIAKFYSFITCHVSILCVEKNAERHKYLTISEMVNWGKGTSENPTCLIKCHITYILFCNKWFNASSPLFQEVSCFILEAFKEVCG